MKKSKPRIVDLQLAALFLLGFGLSQFNDSANLLTEISDLLSNRNSWYLFFEGETDMYNGAGFHPFHVGFKGNIT